MGNACCIVLVASAPMVFPRSRWTGEHGEHMGIDMHTSQAEKNTTYLAMLSTKHHRAIVPPIFTPYAMSYPFAGGVNAERKQGAL